jgi:hypothetical protein
MRVQRGDNNAEDMHVVSLRPHLCHEGFGISELSFGEFASAKCDEDQQSVNLAVQGLPRYLFDWHLDISSVTKTASAYPMLRQIEGIDVWMFNLGTTMQGATARVNELWRRSQSDVAPTKVCFDR